MNMKQTNSRFKRFLFTGIHRNSGKKEEKSKSGFFSKTLKWLGEHEQILTILGIIVPIYFTYYFTFVYEMHNLALIVSENHAENDLRQRLFLIFKNFGNQKEVVSQVSFVISPEKNAKVFQNKSERPEPIKNDPKVWLQIPPLTRIQFDENGIAYSFQAKEINCELLPGFETTVKEIQIENASISKVLSLFTPESKIKLGIEIDFIDSKGKFYKEKIFYARIKAGNLNEKVYFNKMPLIQTLLPAEPFGGYISFAQKTTTPNKEEKIEFPNF